MAIEIRTMISEGDGMVEGLMTFWRRSLFSIFIDI